MGKDATKRKPMNWYFFYTFIRLPLGILANFGQFSFQIQYYNIDSSVTDLWFLVLSIHAACVAFSVVALTQKWPSGYYSVYILPIVTIFLAIMSGHIMANQFGFAVDFGQIIFSTILPICIVDGLNCIYFYKRRDVFLNKVKPGETADENNERVETFDDALQGQEQLSHPSGEQNTPDIAYPSDPDRRLTIQDWLDDLNKNALSMTPEQLAQSESPPEDANVPPVLELSQLWAEDEDVVRQKQMEYAYEMADFIEKKIAARSAPMQTSQDVETANTRPLDGFFRKYKFTIVVFVMTVSLIFNGIFLLVLNHGITKATGDEISSGVVYVTPDGRAYHIKDCSTLKNSSNILVVERSAAAKTRKPCSVCKP